MFGWNFVSRNMSRMLLLQAAAALLVLSERQNILHEGKPGGSSYPNIQVSRFDMSTSTI